MNKKLLRTAKMQKNENNTIIYRAESIFRGSFFFYFSNTYKWNTCIKADLLEWGRLFLVCGYLLRSKPINTDQCIWLVVRLKWHSFLFVEVNKRNILWLYIFAFFLLLIKWCFCEQKVSYCQKAKKFLYKCILKQLFGLFI